MCCRISSSSPFTSVIAGLYVLLATFLIGFFVVQAASSLYFPVADTEISSSSITVLKPELLIWGDSRVDASALCSRLREIKRIPYDPNEKSGDPIYDDLRAAGRKAVPCLIDKLTDTERIEVPYGMMPVNDFRVGDASVFILMCITGQSWEPREMFPPHYAELFKTEGIYAYYLYVEKPPNRKKFQSWWKNWLKNHPVE